MPPMLLSPYQLGSIELPNRVVMAPMTRSRATDPSLVPNAMMVEYYRQRAGAGLIVSEGIFISPGAVGYIHVPGIWSDAQVGGWKQVTEAVHGEGGRIFAQIWHVGALSHPSLLGGELPLAPSAVNPNDYVFTAMGRTLTETPREMTPDDIENARNEYRTAVRNCREAGFDGVEVLASHGYLMPQFWSRNMNRRTDDYGGSIENRCRFTFEALAAMMEEMPADRIGFKINPCVHGYGGMLVDEETLPLFEYLVERLGRAGLAYLHVMEPTNSIEGFPFELPTGMAGHLRPIYSGTLIANTDLSVNGAEAMLQADAADLASFGRAFISNPDLVDRIAKGRKLAEPDSATFYEGGAAGYIDYPTFEKQDDEGQLDFDTSAGIPFAATVHKRLRGISGNA